MAVILIYQKGNVPIRKYVNLSDDDKMRSAKGIQACPLSRNQ